MARCRIGFVGAGGVAARHARMLTSVPDAELLVVTDVDADRARRFGEQVGARPVPDLGALLDAAPDAVYVCVPPFAHGLIEETIAATGTALFVEKPLGLDEAVAERVAGAVAAAGVLTAVGHHWRYSAILRQAREVLAGRPVRLAVGTWLDKVPPVPWWSSRAGSGGQVVEQAVHVLDLARVLVGEVTEVYALGDGAPPEHPGADVDGATVATLRFATGAVGTLAATCRLGWKHRAGLEVCADGVTLALTEDELEVHDVTGPARHRVDPDDAKLAADRAFVDAVLGRADGVLVDYAEGLRTHRLACAVARSAAEAAAVRPDAPARRVRLAGQRGAFPNGAEHPTAEQALVVEAPGRVVLRPEPEPGPLPAGAFDVRTVYSGLSAGTDLSWVKGTNPYLGAAWDAELGLFRRDRASVGYPVTRFGYMQVGTVTASRTPAVRAGETVAMTYGHRTAHRADPLAERFVVLPDDLDPLLGIYVAHMGPICGNGLLHAAAELHGVDVRSLADGVLGRRVVVTGAGVVGLLTGLLARRHGAESVVVLDPAPQRRETAEHLGLPAMDPTASDVAVALKTRWRHGPGDRGADVVFQCRGQASSLALALRVLRPQGTVVDLAFYSDGAGEVRLGEEFHHNGLAVRCAQIGRVPRGLAHLWDRERLSAETVALLRACGRDVRMHLVTQLVPLTEAPALLAELAERRRPVLQTVFTVE